MAKESMFNITPERIGEIGGASVSSSVCIGWVKPSKE
jgi:hypothetical protein